MQLAEYKASEVARRLGTGWVLGADTLVSLDDEIGIPLGKPGCEEEAIRMLEQLSGRSHYVFTGLALIPPWPEGGRPDPILSVARTRVWFRELSETMIEDYVATGEPMDKAGGYGAQGLAAPLIERIDGDFHNVVGLPLCEVGRMLERAGLDWHRAPRRIQMASDLSPQ